MRLNKHGRPYIEPQPKRQCRIKNSEGLIYRATQAPAGLCKCGIMLELKPGTTDYIFQTTKSATHAISHTLKFLEAQGISLSAKEFFVEKI